MPLRKGSAQWNGGIKDGSGSLSTETGTLSSARYSFTSRFEEGQGTNPEELLGAAHAGCFSMAFSLMLGEAGYAPDTIATEAEVEIVEKGGGFVISAITLKTKAKIPNIENDEFQRIARNAKEGCPVSTALAGTEIKLDASLS